MPPSRNIFLIGPMGSGKTAVGKQISRLLKFPFVDSDREIETRTGADIPLIFEREGESGFRKREREAIAELTARTGVVLATGGGAVLDAENRRLLAERGWVVYLETSVAQQTERRQLRETEAPRPLAVHASQHLGRSTVEQENMLIWLPDMSQAAVVR